MKKLILIAGLPMLAGVASASNLIVWNYDTSTANSTSTFIGVIDPSATTIDSAISSIIFSTDAEGGLNTNASGTPTGSVGSFGGTTVNDPRATPAASGSIVMAGNGQDTGGVGTQTNNQKSIFYTVSAASGYTLDLSSLSFAIRGTTTGFQQVSAQISTDGGATYSSLGTAITPTSTFTAYSRTLTNTGLTSFVLRFYYDGATAGGGNVRLDNIVLGGVANAVPEPATMAVIGLGALGVLRRRRNVR